MRNEPEPCSLIGHSVFHFWFFVQKRLDTPNFIQILNHFFSKIPIYIFGSVGTCTAKLRQFFYCLAFFKYKKSKIRNSHQCGPISQKKKILIPSSFQPRTFFFILLIIKIWLFCEFLFVKKSTFENDRFCLFQANLPATTKIKWLSFFCKSSKLPTVFFISLSISEPEFSSTNPAFPVVNLYSNLLCWERQNFIHVKKRK